MTALVRNTKQRNMLTGTILLSVLLIGLSIYVSPNVWAASSASPATPEIKGNIEEGRKIYNGEGFCYQCHGYDGYIDRRPQMAPDMSRSIDQLDPKPADFRDPATLKSKNDQERFDTIKNGHRGTAMFPKKFLSDAKINDILAYLSVLRSEGKRQAHSGRANRN